MVRSFSETARTGLMSGWAGEYCKAHRLQIDDPGDRHVRVGQQTSRGLLPRNVDQRCRCDRPIVIESLDQCSALVPGTEIWMWSAATEPTRPDGGACLERQVRQRERFDPDLDYRSVIPSFARETGSAAGTIQVVPTDLSNSPVGTTVVIRGTDNRFDAPYELGAFVPAPLPKRLDLPGPVWMALSDAMTALGRLDSAASLIPNPQLVTRVATRREAIGTSALEGTFANLTDLFAAEAVSMDETDPSTPPNVREVMNYTRAADAAYDWVQERPITIPLLSSLQAVIVRGTDSDGPEAGALRERQVFIGAKNRPITEARFIPPPPGDQLTVLVDDWLDWINNESLRDSLHLLVRVALAHYQFETIHPYTDGNGRVGRLIAVLQMLIDGALTTPVLSVSDWLKDHAAEYRDHLLQVSMTGNWAPWVDFFARAVAASAEDAHRRVTGLLALREVLASEAREALPRARLAIEIADDLIAFPILTVAAAQARYGKSNQANRDAINRLCELGFLEPYSDARYDRLYWNRRVFAIIES